VSNIKQVIESINKLHGGDREQAAKHAAYLQWLKRRPQLGQKVDREA
jgi:hypothetical protein